MKGQSSVRLTENKQAVRPVTSIYSPMGETRRSGTCILKFGGQSNPGGSAWFSFRNVVPVHFKAPAAILRNLLLSTVTL